MQQYCSVKSWQKDLSCGRKGKFRLNLQRSCITKGRLLGVSIGHPGSIPDCISFELIKIHAKLENYNIKTVNTHRIVGHAFFCKLMLNFN